MGQDPATCPHDRGVGQMDGTVRCLRCGYVAHQHVEEWDDEFGFRFRRVEGKVELLVGGVWVPYLWWL